MAKKTGPKTEPSARKKGFGTLVLRGAVWMAKWKVHGKVYTRTTKCTDRADAEKKLEEFTKPYREKTELEIIENLQAKVRVQEARIKDVRNESEKPVEVEDLLEVMKADVNADPMTDSTSDLYATMLGKFSKFVGKKLAHDVDASDAEKFLADLKKTRVESTYNRYVVLLKRMFDAAMRKDYRIRSNPFGGFRLLKEPKDVGRKELTVEQAERLVAEAAKHGGDVKNLFTLGLYTGMRKSDICGLKWESVDLKAGVLRFLPRKTRKNGIVAVVPIHPKVRAVLEAAPREGEFVFPELERMYRTGMASKHITKIFADAGIETLEKGVNGRSRVKYGFHSLRVFFATNCAREGMPVKQVMKMLGHARPDMSLHYVDAQESDLALPDFDGSVKRVELRKETYELLMKYKGGMDLDDFLVQLLKNGKAPTASDMARAKELEDIDKMIDEVMGS